MARFVCAMQVMVLGAVLYRGPGASKLPLRVTLGVLVTRLILMPIAGVLQGCV